MSVLLAPTAASPRRPRITASLPAQLPPPWRIAWVAALATCAAMETYSLHKHVLDGTLSAFTRWSFRTDTRAGNGVFVLSWVGFAAWYLRHVSRADRQPVDCPRHVAHAARATARTARTTTHH